MLPKPTVCMKNDLEGSDSMKKRAMDAVIITEDTTILLEQIVSATDEMKERAAFYQQLVKPEGDDENEAGNQL